MAKKANSRRNDPNVVIADGEPLDLRNRYLAAVLAFLIPGAGHAFQRRYLKSTIFSISIFFCFIFGLVLSNSKCVYASWDSTEKRWHYFLQAGVGIAAMPAAFQAWQRNDSTDPPLGGFMAAPKSTAQLDQWHHDTASGFDMGTLYTMIAGLLNILVIYDAFAGPLPPPVSNREKNDEEAGGEGKESDSDATTGKST